MFGNTVARSALATPNQRASVAPYWSTAVVGIQRPRTSASLGPPSARVGILTVQVAALHRVAEMNW
jgi:hypothetical protein